MSLTALEAHQIGFCYPRATEVTKVYFKTEFLVTPHRDLHNSQTKHFMIAINTELQNINSHG